MSGKRPDLLRSAVIGAALVFCASASPCAAQAAPPIAGMVPTPSTTPPPLLALPRKPATALPIPAPGPVVEGVPLKLLRPAETLQERCRRLRTRAIDPERPADCPAGRD